MKNEMIKEIVDMEWEMLVNVNSIGGRASCQDDRSTFTLMRESQFLTMNEAVLASYSEDLRKARQDNRNLMTEKYARMMQFTYPEEYELIKDRLPQVDESRSRLIEAIVRVEVEWRREAEGIYPNLMERSRPTHSGSDSSERTSFETYLRGELSTYSWETLRLLARHDEDMADSGLNATLLFLESVAAGYGFSSAESAERSLAVKSG